MKKLLLVLALMTFMVPSAFASSIGIFADDQGTACVLDATTPYLTYSVYVLAMLGAEIPATNAVEFAIDNLPAGTDALTTYTWNTDLVIGEAGDNLALAFSPPLDGPIALLGQLDFFLLTSFADDYTMTVIPGSQQTAIRIVRASDSVTLEVDGGCFKFNCTTDCQNCCVGTPVDDSNWGSIKSLY